MEVSDLFAESATNALTEIDASLDGEAATMTVTVLKLLWRGAASEIHPDDTPGLFWPTLLIVKGKPVSTAGVLALRDRLIVMWSTGWFRTKSSQQVIRYSTVSATTQSVRPPESRIGKEFVTLRITAGEEHELHFLTEMGGAAIATRVEDMIAGTYIVPADVE
jgi:hypothetical protein